MNNIPQKIYLQIDDEIESNTDFKELTHTEVTWCMDKINSKDIEYHTTDSRNAFARSQAIEFAEWCIIEGFYYYPSLKAWMEDPSDLNKYSSSEIYDLFLAEQAKQKEGGKI